jgi:hypothetical protein
MHFKKNLIGTFSTGILLVIALSGCNISGPSEPQPTSPSTQADGSTPLFVKDLNMKVEMQIEPQRLSAIIDALKREGRAEDANRVSDTYDLSTGKVLEKFVPLIPESEQHALAKTSTWDPPSQLKYQSWNNTVWQPYVGWGQTSGGTEGPYIAQEGLIRISYYSGVGAPLISYQVSNYYGSWCSAQSWNGVAGWPDGSGYPQYGLWQLKITTTTALGTNHWVSTYHVYSQNAGWSAWYSQGQAAGQTGPTGNYMKGFEYKINYI